MKSMKKFIWFLLFLALALSQSPNKEINNFKRQIQIEQVQKWFSKGDMYKWRNKKAPLKIIVCQDSLFPGHLIANYDSVQVVRDDSVFEARRFKDGSEWFPHYKVDKNYMKRLTDDYLQGWLEQTNYWLNYLSGNKFQLELEGIERIVTNYWNKDPSFKYGTAFTMIVHPTASKGGFYSGKGIFWINPLCLTYDKNDKNKCSIIPIHEILHGLLGPDHSPDTTSTMHMSANYIGLSKEEADFLEWPKVEPKRLERIKL